MLKLHLLPNAESRRFEPESQSTDTVDNSVENSLIKSVEAWLCLGFCQIAQKNIKYFY